MKFIVDRESLLTNLDYEGNQPCEEARWEKCKSTDKRYVSNPKELKCMGVDEWYTNGVNHTQHDDYISREFEESYWFVEFNSLEELNDFICKYKNVRIEDQRAIENKTEYLTLIINDWQNCDEFKEDFLEQ